MTARVPSIFNEIIREVGFDFDWNTQKVWALTLPVEEMDIAELVWHFAIPFLGEHGEDYNVTPSEIIQNPKAHSEEYERTMAADLKYPIDIMKNKGRWLILDGLHRLMKAFIDGQNTVRVRIVPRELIPEIIKPISNSRE